MRNRFEIEMEELELELIKMGNMGEVMLKKLFEALETRNLDLAKEIITMDKDIDEYEISIEKKCLGLIALQQPIAIDLRKIGSILKIITDIERVGDYVVNIAEILVDFGGEEYIKPLVDLPKMILIVEEMLKKSLDSFIKLDDKLAIETAKRDDEIDGLYERIYEELLEMVNKENKKQIINLLLMGRYLERAADHITNICERNIYIVTGERMYF